MADGVCVRSTSFDLQRYSRKREEGNKDRRSVHWNAGEDAKLLESGVR